MTAKKQCALDKYSRGMYCSALAVTKRHHDAEDAVGDAVLRAVESCHSIEDMDSPEGFCTFSARNAAIDVVKRAFRRYEIGGYDDSKHKHCSRPDDDMIHAEAVDAILSVLPSRQAITVRLHVIDGMPLLAVSAITGVTHRVAQLDYKAGMDTLRKQTAPSRKNTGNAVQS